MPKRRTHLFSEQKMRVMAYKARIYVIIIIMTFLLLPEARADKSWPKSLKTLTLGYIHAYQKLTNPWLRKQCSVQEIEDAQGLLNNAPKAAALICKLWIQKEGETPLNRFINEELQMAKKEWPRRWYYLAKDLLENARQEALSMIGVDRKIAKRKRLFDKGKKLYRKGKYKKAVESFDLALKVDTPYGATPSDGDIQKYRDKAMSRKNYVIGKNHYKEGKLTLAIRDFEECLKYDPSFEKGKEWLEKAKQSKRRYLVRRHKALGEMYLHEGKIDLAINHFGTSLQYETDDNLKKTKQYMGRQLCTAGWECFYTGEYEKSVQCFETALEYNPEEAYGPFNARQGLDKALQKQNRLIRLENASAFFRSLVLPGWGHVYLGEKDSGKALELCWAGSILGSLALYGGGKFYDQEHRKLEEEYQSNKEAVERGEQIIWWPAAAEENIQNCKETAEMCYLWAKVCAVLAGGLWLYGLCALPTIEPWDSEYLYGSLPKEGFSFEVRTIGHERQIKICYNKVF